MVVGKNSPSNPKQPKPRLGTARNIADPAPSDQVHIGEQISGVLGIGHSPEEVAEHSHAGVTINVFKPSPVGGSIVLTPPHLPVPVVQLSR